MSKNPRFWRNVTLIALAHVALIAGLIRWSLAARSAPDAQSLVWLSGVEDLEAGRSETNPAPPTKLSTPSSEPESLKSDDAEKKQPVLTAAKSEIDLPTPKAAPKPTPRKAVLAKASKSSVHAESNLSKSKEQRIDSSKEKKKSANTVSAKNESSSAGKTGSTGKGGGHAGGGSSASEFGWYGNMLHDRFYSAWVQPTTTVASGAEISTLVKVRIEKDGHVSKFEIIKPSENVVVNESVAAIAKRVTEVDPPPVGLGNSNHYDVKINFELNTNQETAK
jgi:outer membrane biosynthesis protein TonB